MELSRDYSFYSPELELGFWRDYNDGVRKITESDDRIACLRRISGIFESLGKSSPLSGRFPEWAADMIEAYRNLVELEREVGVLAHNDPLLEERLRKAEERFI